jgi:hypothetical protein
VAFKIIPFKLGASMSNSMYRLIAPLQTVLNLDDGFPELTSVVALLVIT